MFVVWIVPGVLNVDDRRLKFSFSEKNAVEWWS